MMKRRYGKWSGGCWGNLGYESEFAKDGAEAIRDV